MKLISLFIIFASFTASAELTSETRTCFNKNTIRGFSQATYDSLIVSSNRTDYLVEVWYCSELPFANTIAFDAIGSRVCRSDAIVVYDNFSRRPIQKCNIRNIRRL